jgi:hypothetical protein
MKGLLDGVSQFRLFFAPDGRETSVSLDSPAGRVRSDVRWHLRGKRSPLSAFLTFPGCLLHQPELILQVEVAEHLVGLTA